MKQLVGLVMVALAVACGTHSARRAEGSAATAAELEKGWADPPQSARTRVWWHWMNGNVTKDGVRKDLEWMKRIGLGGVHNFDAALGTPTIVDKRLIYMDEGWQEAFQVAVRTADSLGLEFTIASAPGWSSTGGPWVEPKDAMKRLVWRTVEGSGPFDVVFPEPFSRTGAFQNGAAAGRGEGAELEYYEDISVIAVRQPEDRRSAASLGAKVTSSGGDFTLEQLTDGDIANGSLLPRDDKAGYAWIGYEFPEPVTVRSLTLAGSGRMPGPGWPRRRIDAGHPRDHGPFLPPSRRQSARRWRRFLRHGRRTPRPSARRHGHFRIRTAPLYAGAPL